MHISKNYVIFYRPNDFVSIALQLYQRLTKALEKHYTIFSTKPKLYSFHSKCLYTTFILERKLRFLFFSFCTGISYKKQILYRHVQNFRFYDLR